LRILKQFIKGFDFVRMAPADEIIKEQRITGSMATTTVRALRQARQSLRCLRQWRVPG
jgi:hypothetical protein